MLFANPLYRVAACCLLAGAAHASPVPAAAADAPVSPIGYTPAANYRPAGAEAQRPDQAWREQNRIVASQNSMMLTMGEAGGHTGHDDHAAQAASGATDPHAAHRMHDMPASSAGSRSACACCQGKPTSATGVAAITGAPAQACMPPSPEVHADAAKTPAASGCCAGGCCAGGCCCKDGAQGMCGAPKAPQEQRGQP